MAVNHVNLSSGEELIDLRHDTVTKDVLLKGYTAHGADGEPIVGEYEPESDVVASGSCGENATWTLYSDGRFIISGTGSTIDMTYENYKNSEWYSKYWDDVVTIIIENGITRLGDYFFAGLRKAVSVSIPDSVSEIGDWVFGYCASLLEVVISKNITELGNFAFSGCTSLRHCVIPEGITILKSGVFQACRGLESIVLPKSLKNISNANFTQSSKLAYVYFSGTKTEWDDVEISTYPGDEDDNQYLFTATLCCEYDPNADTVDGWNVNVITDDSDIENITEPTITFMYTVGG
jgi:hypothetical protein